MPECSTVITPSNDKIESPLTLSSLADQLRELEAAKVKTAALEKAIHKQLQIELASLPGRYGFSSLEAFMDAVRAANLASNTSPTPNSAPSSTPGRTPHSPARISKKLKEFVKNGITSKEITKELK